MANQKTAGDEPRRIRTGRPPGQGRGGSRLWGLASRRAELGMSIEDLRVAVMAEQIQRVPGPDLGATTLRRYEGMRGQPPESVPPPDVVRYLARACKCTVKRLETKPTPSRGVAE